MGGFTSGVQQGQPSNANSGGKMGGPMSSATNAINASVQNPIQPSGGAGVDSLYQSVLGRAPDQGGADYWRQQFGDTIDDNERQIFQNSAQSELQGRAQQPPGLPQQPQGMPTGGGGKGGQQLQGMQGASTNSATSGQPMMGAPNRYPNTVGQWDNTQIKPTGQGGKGKGV